MSHTTRAIYFGRKHGLPDSVVVDLSREIRYAEEEAEARSRADATYAYTHRVEVDGQAVTHTLTFGTHDELIDFLREHRPDLLRKDGNA